MWPSLSYYAFSGFFNFITAFTLAIFLFITAKSLPNKLFSYLSFSVAQWSLFYFLWLINPYEDLSSFLIRTCMIGVIFIPTLYIHFVLIFLGIRKYKLFIIFNYLLSVLISSTVYTPLYAKNGGKWLIFPFWPQPGPTFHIAITHFGFITSLACYLMYKTAKEAKGMKRNQILYVLVATEVAIIAGSTNYFSWYRIPIPPFLNIFVSFYVACITYAIVRYRLMDIHIVARKIISNFLLASFFSIFFISILLPKISMFSKISIFFLFSILVSIYLPQFKFILENFINRIFYGTKYDYQETLSEISNTVPTIIDLNKLLKYIADKVCKSMGLAKGAVLLKDDFGNKFSIQYQHGFDGEEASSMKLEAQGPLVSRIKNVADVLVKHEMIQILNEKDYKDLCVDLDKFDAEVVVPIRKGGNVLGLLTLSDKAGGDTFGQEDFRLLHIIAIQAAVAIENIRLYNKLIHTDRQTFLETLASGVSHEMRNRLVAIRTFIDLFPERVQKEHVEQGYYEFRDLAAREMERLTKIIDGLLSYSRAVSKGGEELNLNTLIEESILIIDSKLKDKDIKLIKNLGEKVTSIKGDKGRLLQVFINIMQNGIEAMNKGGGLIITTIEKNNEIEVDISDTGKGIDKEHLDAIFEPFFTTKHNGTGLGLSIVQRIVRDHNGNIKVESELGKGTTFFVSFQKGIEYKPEEIKAKEKLGYWEVKKESEKQETSG